MIETSISLNAWEHFVKNDVFDSSRLNKRIIESWYRCKKMDVNPYLIEGRNVLLNESLNVQREKNSLFLDVASPHLDKMRDLIQSSGMLALLVDPDGYVLSASGKKETLNLARKINFVEGVRWTEGEVGTNAIGTALQIGEAVLITGTEHFSVGSHKWSCAAAPIRNDDGKVIGIIDVSCPLEVTQPHMLGMVTFVAYTIERELSIRIHKSEMELIQNSIDLIESNQPVIVCNYKQIIVSASKMVRKNIPNCIGMHVSRLVEFGFGVQKEVPVYSKDHDNLIGTCRYLSQHTHSVSGNCYSFHELSCPFYFKGEIGTSTSFQNTLEGIRRVAPSNASVYILGETGTGKEVIANTIHENSQRKNGPFIAVNCGAIPKELMESELFGYVEGAFTGARRQGYKGKFEQANHGTLFLDEIGEIPQSMQVAILRVLQEHKVTPVGGNKEIPLDIRIISATHRDLRQLIKEGKFREDLYYRLNVFPIHVPSLRERKEDIPDFVQYFCKKNEWNIEIPVEFLEKLMDYDWPGNIRELQNVLERLQILSQNENTDKFQLLYWLDTFDMQLSHKSQVDTEQENKSILTQSSSSLTLTFRENVQKELMIDVLQKAKGNVSIAAKLSGIPRSTFYKKMQKFNL